MRKHHAGSAGISGTSFSPDTPVLPPYQISQMKESELARQMEEDRERNRARAIEPSMDDGPSER